MLVVSIHRIVTISSAISAKIEIKKKKEKEERKKNLETFFFMQHPVSEILVGPDDRRFEQLAEE